jgi:hypothetical protein
MFSDDRDGRQARALFLSSPQFEVIFQITHQLSNFQESRLEALGCSHTDLDSLLVALGPIRDQADTSSRVRIDLYDDTDKTGLALEDVGADIDGAEAHGRLPREVAVRWKSLTDLVISALSPRELFLRTGYDLDVIRDAIARLAEIGE